jgi:hypothetical protein
MADTSNIGCTSRPGFPEPRYERQCNGLAVHAVPVNGSCPFRGVDHKRSRLGFRRRREAAVEAAAEHRHLAHLALQDAILATAFTVATWWRVRR